MARKPLGASGMLVLLATRTTQLPSFCSSFLTGLKCSMASMGRAPTTMSALPATMGAVSKGMSSAWYWLSASVLTMTSAPRSRQACSPFMKPRARPWLRVWRTTWSTPCSSATFTVSSVLPSSMISHSTVSNPATSRGRADRAMPSVSASLKQGIWMMSFKSDSRSGRAPVQGRAQGNMRWAMPQLSTEQPGRARRPKLPSRYSASNRNWQSGHSGGRPRSAKEKPANSAPG